MDPALSIVVPLYNEEENVVPLIEEIAAALDPSGVEYEIVCVDDGSRDATLERLQAAAEGRPRLRVFGLERNCGQSAALLRGLRQARGGIIATLDGDLQNDPADIRRLLPALEETDLVCGWRRERRDPWNRRFASRVANAVRGRFLGDGLHDGTCPLKLLRREVVRVIPLFDGVHMFLPAIAAAHGFRIAERVVGHRPRRAGLSKYPVFRIAGWAFANMIGVKWLCSRAIRRGRHGEEQPKPLGKG